MVEDANAHGDGDVVDFGEVGVVRDDGLLVERGGLGRYRV